METFLKLNAVDYMSLPYSGEHEAEHDLTHKTKWGRAGVKALKDLAKTVGGIPVKISHNPSGSIDRGYVSGFITSLDGSKVVYISIGDGFQFLLFRTADDTNDYRGHSNNETDISAEGFGRLESFLRNKLRN